MSKNKQILIFSGIGLAVLGGVAAVLMLTAPKEETPSEDIIAEEEKIVLADKTVSEIASLHIKNEEGEYDIVNTGEKDGEGNLIWTIPGLESAQLNYAALSAAAANASVLEVRQLVEEDAEELEKYGLSEPKAQVTVNYSDGTDYTFRYGIETPTSAAAVYFSGEDEKDVYTFTKSQLTAFEKGKFDYIQVQVMPDADTSGEEDIEVFRIERKDLEEPIVIERIPEPEDPDEIAVFTFRLTSPYSVNADLTDSPTFIYSLFGLSADRAVWYGMTEKDYAISGLDDPSCVFTLETNKKTYTVKLGNPIVKETEKEDGTKAQEIVGFYGMSSEVPDTLYEFSASSIPAASIQPESIISNLFFMPYIYSLSTIEYEDSEGTSFKIDIAKTKEATETESAEYSYKLNGGEANEQLLKNMYQYLISASGDELYFGEADDKLLAQVRYVYADSSRGEEIVKFYSSSEDRRVIINVNGENIFKTKQIYVTQLMQNAASFINGGEIILTY